MLLFGVVVWCGEFVALMFDATVLRVFSKEVIFVGVSQVDVHLVEYPAFKNSSVGLCGAQCFCASCCFHVGVIGQVPSFFPPLEVLVGCFPCDQGTALGGAGHGGWTVRGWQTDLWHDW